MSNAPSPEISSAFYYCMQCPIHQDLTQQMIQFIVVTSGTELKKIFVLALTKFICQYFMLCCS